jgi:hypothetical protein
MKLVEKEGGQNKMSWFKVNRQLFESSLWLREPFSKGQAWIDLFGNANHKDASFFIRGNEVKVKRGQLGWSEVTMAKRWKWSRNKVRRFLKWLESEHQVAQQKLFKITTIITIINYDKFQSETTDDTTKRQQAIHRQEDKNDKNIYKQQKPIVDKKELLKRLGMENIKGASYEWQDYAIRLWGKLGLGDRPSSGWFKLFKMAFINNKKLLLDLAYSFVQDANAQNPERLFYWKFNRLLKGEKN